MTRRSMQSKAIGVTSVAIYICAVASLIEGIFVLGANEERWSIISVDLVSQYPYTWGGSLVVASILLFVANRFSKILRDSCLYISAVWNVLFGIAVTWHAFLDVQPHLPRVIGNSVLHDSNTHGSFHPESTCKESRGFDRAPS